jgi:hypothetical protein
VFISNKPVDCASLFIDIYQGILHENKVSVSCDMEIPYDRERHGEIPQRFIAGCKGNMEEAARRWSATAEWRMKEHIDSLLDIPQHKFSQIKSNYPQYVHGRAKNGHYVYYERPGLADFNVLTQVEGV